MIVRRMRVEGWACFANPIEIGPFDERLNIIAGPNGTGKSTLLKILTRGMVDTYCVGGAEAHTLRPWGRSLTPKVTIEFRHAGVEYRLSKRFLDRPMVLLEMRDNARWTRLAEDGAADQTIRELLRAEAPGAGLSNPKHWGIIQVLWAPQDAAELPPLSGDVLADIHAALGVQISGSEGLELERRIADLYRQFYTPTGRLRGGAGEPPVARLRRERIDANETVAKAREQLRKLEMGRESIAVLQARYDGFCKSAEQVAAEVNGARLQLTRYQTLASEKAGREQCKRAAEAEYLRIRQQVDMIRACANATTDAERDLAAINEELPRVHAHAIEAQQIHEKATASLEEAQASQARARDAADQAALARRFVGLQGSLATLLRRLEGVELADLEINRCRSAVGALRAPSQKQLAEIRAAVKTRDDAGLRLESSLIKLELEPISDCSIRVDSGDQAGEQHIPGGASARISGSREIEIEILGFGRIRAMGPAGSAVEHRRQFEQAAVRVQTLIASFDGADLNRLEELSTEVEALERDLQAARGRLDGYLMGKSVSDLRAEREQLGSALAEIQCQQPSWATAPPDVVAMEASAQELQGKSQLEMHAAQDALKLAQGALNDVNVHERELSHRYERRNAEILGFHRRLEDLRADGKSDALRLQELEHKALEWDSQKAAVEKLEQSIATYPADPDAVVAALEAQAAQVTRGRDQARDQLRDQEAQVRYLSSVAPYATLAEAEEKLEAISVSLRDEEVRTEAARLLYDTVQACRSETVAAIPERVAGSATSILHRIAGTGFKAVCLSEGLAPTGVSPTSVGAAVPFTDLSGGEKEQISFAVRLALAGELARAERQLLVLDDSLTTTDPARFERILKILDESADELQVLVLTCDPERYAALRGAKLHDLALITEKRTTGRAA